MGNENVPETENVLTNLNYGEFAAIRNFPLLKNLTSYG